MDTSARIGTRIVVEYLKFAAPSRFTHGPYAPLGGTIGELGPAKNRS